MIPRLPLSGFSGRGALLFILASTACGSPSVRQAPEEIAPLPASELHYREEIFSNDRVTASILELPPENSTTMHRHDQDLVVVFLDSGYAISTLKGHTPVSDSFAAGEVRFRAAGFTHSSYNSDKKLFRAAVIEFINTVGFVADTTHSPVKYCNAGQATRCVNEKFLFCTDSICVTDVIMDSAAVRPAEGQINDEVLVAVSHCDLVNTISENSVNRLSLSSGQIVYIPGGSSHEWKNTGNGSARFILVAFR